jgi:outer membrane protein assembly factor BamB
VTLEFPRLQGHPSGIVANSSGVYLAGSVLTADDARSRRWAVVKLDAATGNVAWSNVDELPRSPAPERIVLADSGLYVAGQDETHEAARLLAVERRDPATGKRTWQRRFTGRDAKCTNADCAGKDTFGGIAVAGSSVYFSSTVDRPIEEAYGELSAAKGTPGKAEQTRSDLRARDIANDGTTTYLLDENLSSVVMLNKLAEGKAGWKQDIDTDAKRLAVTDKGLLLWGTTVELREPTKGKLVWTSNLVGGHIDVAADASGLYVNAMVDDGKRSPFFGVVKLDAATGAVQWVRKTSESIDNHPSVYVAVDGDWLYVFGIEDDKWYVERRRKSDAALGEVTTTARTVEPSKKKK